MEKLKQENEELKKRIAVCEEELAEQKEFRNYVMHNHPNVTEDFEMVQDVKRYQNEPEALGTGL